MKLAQLKVSNFRCYKEETVLDIDDLTVLIGKNDAGKSSLFDAMDIFFDSKGTPDIDDLSIGAKEKEICISCSFSDIPQESIIDVEHNTNLADEYLLNENNLLEIVKIFDCTNEKPKEKGVYIRANHPTANGVDDLHSLTNAQLKKRVEDLLDKDTKVNKSINADMRRTLWESKGRNLNLEAVDIEVSKSKGDAKAIWATIKNLLPVFSLFKADRIGSDQDSEAKDPMKVIVKEVIQSKIDQLEAITKEVEVEVEAMARKTIDKVVEMNRDLEKQLEPKISAENWDRLFSVNLASEDGIKVNKRGSGTRKLILLNFFRVKAEEESEKSRTGAIYAFEEPETSQHPDNQLRLIRAFEDIAMRADSQVLFSTHTPNLARKLPHNFLRFISIEDNDKPIIYHGAKAVTMNMIVNSLGVLPDHGVKVFLGVEGKNDIEFIRIISRNLSRSETDIPDIEEAEKSGKLIFFFIGGCGNLDFWVSKLNKLKIPEFYLIDGDNCPIGNHKHQATINQHRTNGHTVWLTEKRELENYIHLDLIKSQYPNYKGKGKPDEDVPKLCSDSSGEKENIVKKTLNRKVVSKMTPQMLDQVDTNDEVRGWLREIGKLL